MAVQVSEICDRCGRSTPVHMDNEKLVAETEKRKQTELMCKEIEEFFSSKDPTLLPTLLVVYKNPVGVVTTASQISVCNPKDDGKRSCTKRIAELISDLFPVPVDQRAPRAPRKPKEDKKEKNGEKGRGGK
jgi:hypothetical protein